MVYYYRIYVMREGGCCGASTGEYLPQLFSTKRDAEKAMKAFLKNNPRTIAWLSEK